MHDDTYISGRSENNIVRLEFFQRVWGSFYKNALYKFTVITVINIKCVVHDDLGRKNQTTQYILPRHWLYD